MTVERVAEEFACQHFGPGVKVTLVPLRGGLESQGIARVLVRRREKPVGSFVAKPLTGAATRELQVYRLLKATAHHHLSPALLGWRHVAGQNDGYAFLEWISADTRWPWRNVDSSARVIEHLAVLHRNDPAPFEGPLADWDYERELSESAYSTLDAYRGAFLTGVRPGNRPLLRVLERVVTALPRLRRELFQFTGTTLLHGDAHPGNVVANKNRPVFLDWARARIGSPLEDVSSWVHSLSVWEPEAKRKHDTLLKRYSAARGGGATVSRSFRDAYVIAGACNALAGALRYHLSVIHHPERTPRAKFDSYRAASDWLRVVRRADICCGL